MSHFEVHFHTVVPIQRTVIDYKTLDCKINENLLRMKLTILKYLEVLFGGKMDDP